MTIQSQTSLHLPKSPPSMFIGQRGQGVNHVAITRHAVKRRSIPISPRHTHRGTGAMNRKTMLGHQILYRFPTFWWP
jgi:hypothetical protein